MEKNQLSAYCHVKWDPDTQKFVKSSHSDAVKCCVRSCHDIVKNCLTRGVNSDKCNEIITNCSNNCMEIKSEYFDTIRKCFQKSGCGRFPEGNSKCVGKFKSDIINCCRENLDLQECSTLYNVALGKAKRPLADLETEYGSISPTNTNHNSQILFYTACIGLALFCIYAISSTNRK